MKRYVLHVPIIGRNEMTAFTYNSFSDLYNVLFDTMQKALERLPAPPSHSDMVFVFNTLVTFSPFSAKGQLLKMFYRAMQDLVTMPHGVVFLVFGGFPMKVEIIGEGDIDGIEALVQSAIPELVGASVGANESEPPTSR